MWGQVLSGMARGLFASVILLGCGYLVGSHLALSVIFVCCLAAQLLSCRPHSGVIVGLISRSHDDAASFTNFFIMPMAFFSGTFFPVEEMPWLVQKLILVLPLTHVNNLLRHPAWSSQAAISLAVIGGYSLLSFLAGVVLIRRYDE